MNTKLEYNKKIKLKYISSLSSFFVLYFTLKLIMFFTYVFILFLSQFYSYKIFQNIFVRYE